LQGLFFKGNVQNGGVYPAYTTVAKDKTYLSTNLPVENNNLVDIFIFNKQIHTFSSFGC
jgi:hypothetical protein